MPRNPTRNLRRLPLVSPIANYRVADLPEIFSLYLNVVEVALRNSAESASVPADDGQRRDTVGKAAGWHVV